MKKIILSLFMLLLCIDIAQAQVPPPYAFSSSNGTYTEMTSGATLLPLMRVDTYTSPAQNIGFTFNYAGMNYSQFVMSSNGLISLTPTATSLSAVNDLSGASTTSRPIIAPLWDDLDGAGSTTSVAGYEISGTAPNRVLTIEWRNWEWNFAANNAVISFQVKLYETTNVIQFVYRQDAGAVNNGTASIGINSATGTGTDTFLNLTNDAFPTVSTAIAVNNIATKPLTGQTFTFTPTTCLVPTGLVTTNILQNSATITWAADTPAAPGYEYIVQPANATSFATATSVVTNTANVVGLTPNTQYNVYLRKNCGSAFSSPVLAGTFRTLCNLQTEFVETFDTYPSTGTAFYADCWGKSNMTGNAYLTTGGVNPGSAPNRLFFSNSTTTTAVAVLPAVSNLQANTHRLVFKSYATVVGRTIDVGYLTNAADFTSFVVVQNLSLASTAAANATTQTVIPTGIPAGITSLAFRLTGAATTAYLDDVKWEQISTCLEPISTVATGITTTTAQIDWTEPTPAPANGYDYFLSTSTTPPMSSATPTGSVAAGLNSLTLTGLVPSTTYYVYVRSRCSATSRSPWTIALNFLTNCTDITTFSQNFDTALTFPNCWKRLGTGGAASIVTTAAVSAPNSLSLNSSGSPAVPGLVVMPPVSNAGAGTHRLTFRARSSFTVGGVIQVGYVTDNFDANSFVSVQSFTPTSLTNFDVFSAVLGTAPGTNKFLAFRHSASNTNAVLIDNVVWEPIPNCLEPTSVTASTITNNSAVISWIEPLVPAAAGYEYFVATTNSAPTAASAATGSVGAGMSTANITLLNSATTYFVWVRSVCSATDKSAWTASTSFITACAAVTNFTQNFDTSPTGVGTLPICWNRAGTSANVYNTTISAAPMSPPNRLYMNISATTTAFAILPLVSNLQAGTHRLKFKGYATTTGRKVQVGYFTNSSDASTFTLIQEFDLPGTAATTATEFTVNLTALPVGVTNLVISLLAGTATTAYFDDFIYEALPSCIETNTPAVSAITTTAATVTWTAPASSPANGYEYFLATTNVTPSAASMATGSTAAGITTVNLTSLNAATTYFVWIRSVCSTTDKSAWSTSTSFITACTAVTDFTQNFDTSPTGVGTLPLCWNRAGTSANVYNTTVSAAPMSPPNRLYMNISATTTAFAILPPVSNLQAGTHRLKFKGYATGTGRKVQVGYFTNSSDASTFTLIQEFDLPGTAATTATEFTVNLAALPAGVTNLVITLLAGTATTAYFDDFIYGLVPSCIETNNPTVSAITSSAATVTWTAPVSAPANGYEYFLATTNVTPSAASMATGSTAAGNTTVNLTNLNAATTYFVWVRSVCSATDKSAWSGVASFATACLPITTLPWNESFESVTTVGSTNFPPCWVKENGDYATAIAGTYNTPRTGTNYLRNSWSATNEYMWTPGFNLTAGVSYDFSSYVQGDGGTGWAVDYFVNGTQNSSGAIQIGGTYAVPGSGTIDIQPYALVTRSFIPTTSGTYYFAVRVNQPSSSPWYVAFDDFNLKQSPSCFAPTATAANITSSSATISWNAVPSAALGYEYALNTTATPPVGSGTLISGTTFSATVLTPATTYYFHIRSVCSATELSSWSTITFTTLCTTSAVPYVINFESAIVPNLPLCTTNFNAGTGNNWTVAANPGSGFTSNTLRYSWNATNAANAWFFTNGISLTAGTQYKINYRYGGASNTFVERLKVAYGTAATVAGMTTQLADHPNINTNVPVTAPEVTFTPITTGIYYFGFNAYSIANQLSLFVDDIAIDAVLGNNTFNNDAFRLYPNPVRDILSLEYNQKISIVSVFNLLGQQVIVQKVNANSCKIDMSSLSAGTYLVKVSADNQVKNIKVLKE